MVSATELTTIVAGIVTSVAMLILASIAVYQYLRGEQKEVRQKIREVSREIGQARRAVQEGKTTRLSRFKEVESDLPRRVVSEVDRFSRIVDDFSRERRLLYDLIKLAVFEAVMVAETIPRLPSSLIEGFPEGRKTWLSGGPVGSRTSHDYVDLALYETLREHLVEGGRASRSWIKDNSPVLYEQLAVHASEEDISSLSQLINRNVEQRTTGIRDRLRRLTNEASSFRFRTLRPRPV